MSVENKVQSLIFSRGLVNDADSKGEIEEFDNFLKQLNKRGIKVAFITQGSQNSCPSLRKLSAKIELIKCPNRGRRNIAKEILEHIQGNIDTSVIISTSDMDIIMAANSGLLSLTAGWVDQLESKPRNNGIIINSLDGVTKALELLKGTETWYSVYERNDFKIFSLLNAGDFKNLDELKPLIKKLKEDLKIAPDIHRPLFGLLLASSLLKTEELKSVNYMGIYPSSSPTEFKEELIYSYYETSKFAISNKSRKEPIFIRNKKSLKRHLDSSDNRFNPNLQLSTININHYYKDKLQGKSVLVLDDFVTNGTSFWVANALLKKAGASRVFGVSLGKYGKRLHDYKINLSNRDPFSPCEIDAPNDYKENDDAIINPRSLREVLGKFRSIS